MEKTANEAFKLTEAATGRHHIGDFLPPEELTKFMAKVTFFCLQLRECKIRFFQEIHTKCGI
jgi:hypothetical protein